MKKLAIIKIRFPLHQGEVHELDLPAFCRVLGAIVLPEQHGVVITKNQRKVIPVPWLILEVDPDAPIQRRRFIAIPTGMQCEVEAFGGTPEFGAMFENPQNGQVAVVYHAAIVEQPTP